MGDAYKGRLGFDPDANMHHSMVAGEDGNLVPGGYVITEDGGRTWRYADEGDPTHFGRYHKQYAPIDSTANVLLELQVENGRAKAEEIMRDLHPHHFIVQPDDDHYEEDAKDAAGVVNHTHLTSHPDVEAAKYTGHTDSTAWKFEGDPVE